MIEKKFNYRNITIYILVAVTLMVSLITLIILNNRSIIIYDTKGREYYKITEKLVYNHDDEMIIKKNGAADSIIKDVLNDLVKNKGYSNEEAITLLNKKNYKIYSTIDSSLQQELNEAFKNRSTFTETKKAVFNQAAMVIMDYEGNVKALSTGNNGDNTKNRATSTLLKVGSTIKPVAIYAPAIENNIVNFSTIIPDMPGNTYINGQAVSWPSNFDNKYESNVTITDALKKSKNTIAVTVGKMIGEEKIFNFLKDKLEFTTLVNRSGEYTDKQLAALALGYFTEGTTLDTLVSSYSIFGNNGNYSNKRYYTEVKDKQGHIVLSNNSETIRAISEETATIMNRLLFNNIVDKDSIIKNVSIDGVEVIGKTGTVGNDNDNIVSQLFVGMTPDYVAGVWVGYDDDRPLMQGLYTSPSQVWKKIMSNVNIKNTKFKLSEKVIEEDYCTISGLIKSENCKSIKKGYYNEVDIPNVCDICK